jgi:ABC-type transporter Mla subunit MlaD
MNGRLIGLLVVASLAAGCGTSSGPSNPVPKPTPANSTAAAVTAALQDYGKTFDSALPQFTAISDQLRHCVSPTTQCQHAAAESRVAAVSLLQQLGSDDQLRESTTNGVLAPGVSPIVIESERDAQAVRRASASISVHSNAADLTSLASKLGRLVTKMNAWNRRFK